MARLFGFGPSVYRRVAQALPLRPGMRVLDMGCGTASLGLAMAERIGAGGCIHDLDLSQDQLAHAGRKTNQSDVTFEFHQCSMDEFSFEPATFDAIVTCMAFHEVTPEVRRAAQALKPGWRTGGPSVAATPFS